MSDSFAVVLRSGSRHMVSRSTIRRTVQPHRHPRCTIEHHSSDHCTVSVAEFGMAGLVVTPINSEEDTLAEVFTG